MICLSEKLKAFKVLHMDPTSAVRNRGLDQLVPPTSLHTRCHAGNFVPTSSYEPVTLWEADDISALFCWKGFHK